VELGAARGLNAKYESATNGEIVLGVHDSLLAPPEFVAFDLKSQQLAVLSDLNPALHRRRYGQVERIFWRSPFDTSFAYLIKPVKHVVGVRYPLAVIWTDALSEPWDSSFILDGQHQLSAYAIQTLAGAGIMVMLVPCVPSYLSVIETPEEGVRMQKHVESGIAYLNHLGLIDTTRVAISGWSRAANETVYMLIQSEFPYAAASSVGEGGLNIFEGGRPWSTAELTRVHVPYLMEEHGSAAVESFAMYDQLRVLRRSVEFLFIRGAPHWTVNPLHRWRSLSAHTDWFRFWLQRYEDPDPAKRDQYARWRELRKLQKQQAAVDTAAVRN